MMAAATPSRACCLKVVPTIDRSKPASNHPILAIGRVCYLFRLSESGASKREQEAIRKAVKKLNTLLKRTPIKVEALEVGHLKANVDPTRLDGSILGSSIGDYFIPEKAIAPEKFSSSFPLAVFCGEA